MQGLEIVDSSGRQMAHKNFLLPLLYKSSAYKSSVVQVENLPASIV
jgi:hypothetical protein